MKIEMLTLVRHDGQEYRHNKQDGGEIRIVEAKLGEYFCAQGWARDLSGGARTATPDTAEKMLEVQAGKHGQRTTVQE